MEFGYKIKKEWLLDDEVIFLNHGSFGATPIKVLHAKEEIERRLEKEPLSFLLADYPISLKKSLLKLADFVGANADDIVLVENATTGINTVLRSLENELKPGDEIITPNHVYSGIRNTMKYIAERTGAKAIEFDIPFPNVDNEMILEIIKKQINERTKILIVDHVTSPTSLIFPINEIVDLCRTKGIISIIDGAHAPGMIEVNMNEIGADFYTGNCHKWMFTPKGCALLWISKKWQKKIHPLVISLFYGNGIQSEFGWTGTKNPSSWLALSPAIDFYKTLGFDRICEYNHKLICEATELICDELDIHKHSDYNMLGFMSSIEFPVKMVINTRTTMDLRNQFMRDYKIELSFHNLNDKIFFRISSQVYNEIDDYKKLIPAIKDFISKNR